MLCRHFLASARSAGSNEASNAWYLANLFHGARWVNNRGVEGLLIRLGSLIQEGLIMVSSLQDIEADVAKAASDC